MRKPRFGDRGIPDRGPARALSGGSPAALRRFLGRARRRSADESLRTSLAILTAQQEASVDGILIVDQQGNVLSHNRRFLEIWGIPADVAERGQDAELLEFAFSSVADADSFLRQVKHLYEHPLEKSTGDLVALKDGRVLSRTSVPVIAGDGALMGRAWYFREITEQVRGERLQSALFRIAEVSRSAATLDELYRSIHSIVGELMDATNFYIALYDHDTGLFTFPYFVDQMDAAPPAAASGRGLTSYVLRTGNAVLVDPEEFGKMVERGDVEDVGAPSVDWLGVPLRVGEHVYGVLGVQSYDEQVRFGAQERDILMFVSQHVATAIEQKRREDALRESERRYRQMFESNRAVKLVIDPRSGRIVDANLAAVEFYRYPAEELKQKHIWEINTLPEQQVRQELARAETEQRAYFVFRHRLANGETRDVEIHSGPIDISGQRYLYSIVHDITERKRAEEALRHSEGHFRTLIENTSDMISAITPEGVIRYNSPSVTRVLGYDARKTIGGNVFDFIDPADADQVRTTLERAVAAPGLTAPIEFRILHRDRSWRTFEAVAQRLTNDVERPDLAVTCRDITERKSAEITMATQAAAISASMDGIAVLSGEGTFLYVNEAFAGLYGYSSPAHLIGRKWTTLHHPQEWRRLVREILPSFIDKGRWRGVAEGKKKNGLTFPEEISLTGLPGGDWVCVVRDITERTHAEEQIKHLAYHDALTGLPNRLLFKDRLSVALAHAQRNGLHLAVLFLDLDRFKIINDSLGHNFGDHLLQAVAARIQSCLRESDTVARLGGDEFIVLLPALQQSEDAVLIARKILENVRRPFMIEGREVYVTTSIGISLFPEDSAEAESLIKNSDTSMYQAKDQGRDTYQLFNHAISARALERLAIENGLRKAISADEFIVHYQPLFDLRTGRIHGMEALVRWKHPELGLVSPADFIPVAEATGLMVPIGAWVLATACQQQAEWHRRGFRNLSLAVNLSVRQLQHAELLDTVRNILGQTGTPPGLLELEITESSAMQNPEKSIQLLEDLKRIGVKISIDDFGIGHSSLSHLKRFPIDTLKIDQSFIRDITDDEDTATIVAGIIAMGHTLRLRVVAEGVETESQRMVLIENRCDLMQGFLLKGPVPADEFESLLYEHNKRAQQWPRITRNEPAIDSQTVN